jgi:CheY-like chemotaxis protein
VLNLVGNAVKYSDPGGKVVVTWDGDDERVRIDVSDDGPGIAEEDVAEIFAPFERAGASVGAVEGTGLGLAVAQALVEAMGGTISVRSELGRGSTFSVELATTVQQAEPVTSARSRGGTRLTVLHIEDNPTSRTLVRRVVGRVPGMKVVAAATATEGLEIAASDAPDAILLDLHLADATGYDVLERLRADPGTASIPVVMMSADTTRSSLERALQLGANEFLTKPVDANRLLAILAELAES